MKEANVQVKHRKKYKVTTNSDHKQPVFDNVLDRQFDVDQPDQMYVDDITCLWTRLRAPFSQRLYLKTTLTLRTYLRTLHRSEVNYDYIQCY